MKRALLLVGGTVSCAALGCTSAPAPATAFAGAGGGIAAGGTAGSVGGVAGSNSLAGASAAGGASGASGVSGAAPPDAATDAALPPVDSGTDAGDAALPPLPMRVLLYHFSTLDIPSVPAQLTFFQSQLTAWQYESDESVDPSEISDQNLERYSAVAMINTCFEPFGAGKPDKPQSEVLQRFLQRGGGLFGTHCASVTFQSDMPPALYNQVLGGRGGNGFFDGTSACRTTAQHPSTVGLAASFSFVGNLDNTDFLAPDSVVLVKCQWQTDNGKDVAASWYRNEGLGRVFYTDFAKVDADLTAPTLGAHIVAGLAWVLRRP